MKLMTLNTHSLIEKNYSQKLNDFILAVFEKKPDIIALQEVNQSMSADVVSVKKLMGYFHCEEKAVIRSDNHVYNAVNILREKGLEYYWTWLPVKCGYSKYTEGIALMSRSPITEAIVIGVSEINNFYNWKTRKIVGIKTEKTGDELFFSVHYGWWNDREEPFCNQWKNTLEKLPKADKIWLMGDFNNPEQISNEGYDLILSDGWYDSYEYAKTKDNGITVGKAIDGWKDKITSTDGMRIDLILCSKKAEVLSSEVIFNGKNYPVVSDHYGVLIEYERSKE